jgi:hypothetical protein
VKLQASDASSLESLQSQSQRGAKNRIRFNGLKVVHGRLITRDCSGPAPVAGLCGKRRVQLPPKQQPEFLA